MKRSERLRPLVVVLVWFVATAPADLEAREPRDQTEAPTATEVVGLYPTLWAQYAAERRALALQTYQMATAQLDAALADPTWTAALEQRGGYEKLPPAVILDVDETVLDNSPFQARIIHRRRGRFSGDLWNAWVREARAEAMPGALDFCRTAASKGVAVVFITNRKDPLKEATAANLEARGFPVAENLANILTRGEVADKGPRRAQVAAQYRILILVGDNATDFASPFSTTNGEARFEAVDRYRDYWGSKWFILPNPMYGSWLRALPIKGPWPHGVELIEAQLNLLKQR